MKIILSNNLIKLAKLLNTPLYVTGGYIRNSLLNLPSSDIDICSGLIVEEIIDRLNGSNFICTNIYPRMGTLKIMCIDTKENYEYTCFRKENYLKGHTPDKVEFGTGILEDALRRDFKINAVYYDINNEKIIDPLNGTEDIKNKTISCVKDPLDVFNFDGLRLLRLVRFSAELNLKIEEKTYDAAKLKSDKLKDISVERKTDEFLKIIYSDKRYNLAGNENAHYYALKKLIDLNLIEYLIPQLLKGDKVLQRSDFHKYDVLEHSLQAFKFSDPKIRLSALLHDVGKPYVFNETGKMAGHDIIGAKIAGEILSRQIKIPIKQKKDILAEIEAHMFDVDGKTSEKKVRLFFLKYYDHLENIFLLKGADYLGCGIQSDKSEILIKWENILQKMKDEKIPFKIKELKLNGNDLIGLGIKPEKIGETLNYLLRACVTQNVSNNKESLTKAIKGMQINTEVEK